MRKNQTRLYVIPSKWPARTPKEDKSLIDGHHEHLGLYKRIAGSMEVDASYVSKVAGGTRTSEPVKRKLLDELDTLRIKGCKKMPVTRV
jgi:hypothetical protein